MKIAYCGYDFFHTCLRYLLDEGHEIKRVFSFKCDGRFNFNDYVKELAKTAKIPYTERAITEMDIEKLQELGVDCLITAGYSYKIPDLSQTSIKGINIHPTLLPQGRGVWPLPHVILRQLSNSGVTLHKITNEWDGGDILVQQGFSISDSENLESLSARTQMLATTLLKQTLSNLDQLWRQAQPQEGEISNWPMPDSNDRFIRWQMGVEQIDRICRAFGKFSAFAVFEDRLWNVYDLTAWQQVHNDIPGTKVHITNTETIIAASDGYVCLRYFQACEDPSFQQLLTEQIT